MTTKRHKTNPAPPLPDQVSFLRAYAWAIKHINPAAPRKVIERGLRKAFKQVEGFTQVVGECVEVSGRWYDLIIDFQGRAPRWVAFDELPWREQVRG